MQYLGFRYLFAHTILRSNAQRQFSWHVFNALYIEKYMRPHFNPVTVFVRVCIRDDDETANPANTQNVTDYTT